jgi:hypothetical protein
MVGSYQALWELQACPTIDGDSSTACDFSGLALIIDCGDATLDALGQGRFFLGEGTGSSLTLKRCILKNGKNRHGYGGAILIKHGAYTEIHTSTLESNHGGNNGGAISHQR